MIIIHQLGYQLWFENKNTSKKLIDSPARLNETIAD